MDMEPGCLNQDLTKISKAVQPCTRNALDCVNSILESSEAPFAPSLPAGIVLARIR